MPGTFVVVGNAPLEPRAQQSVAELAAVQARAGTSSTKL